MFKLATRLATVALVVAPALALTASTQAAPRHGAARAAPVHAAPRAAMPHRAAAPRAAMPRRAGAPHFAPRRAASVPHRSVPRVSHAARAPQRTVHTQSRTHQRTISRQRTVSRRNVQAHRNATRAATTARERAASKAKTNAERAAQAKERAAQAKERAAKAKADRAAQAKERSDRAAKARAEAKAKAEASAKAKADTRATANARAAKAGENRRRSFVAAPRERGKGADARRRLALHNAALAETARRDRASRALARSTFRGHFHDHRFDRRLADRHWWWRRHVIVIGWIGPIFWPYAYDDFVDYAFYPYAYDTFWPYAYDEVYEGIFGPYAYGSTDYASVRSTGSVSESSRRGRSGRAQVVAPAGIAGGDAEVCTGAAPDLINWPIERIDQIVQPNEDQRAALDELKDATAKAVDLLQSACPSDLPSTPTGRMAAMRKRIESMRQAVEIVQPALDKFYQSLSDEQKAQFNAIGQDEPQARTARARANNPDLTKACTTPSGTAAPIARIEQAVRLNEAQRAPLDELDKASQRASEILKANCPQEDTLTPPGRLDAMAKRLDAMLQALDAVQPALEKFYSSLSDEQKAQFNRLSRQQA